MQLRLICHLLSLTVLLIVAALVVVGLWDLAMLWAGHADDPAAVGAIGCGAAGGLVLGGTLWLIGRGTESRRLTRRDGLLLVCLAWACGCAVAALPYIFWPLLSSRAASDHAFHDLINCCFEAISGLTTTGSTILPDPGALPRSLLLWRSTTHWLGGLGIVVMFVALFPMLGVGGKVLFQFENSMQGSHGQRPMVRNTARSLWLIYLVLTVAQVLLLRIFGMSWFDAVCETFGTVASGGFSTQTASTAAYQSLPIELTTVVFMLLTGVSYALYIQLLHRRFRDALRSPELRLYLISTAVGVAIVTGCIYGRTLTLTTGQTVEAGLGEALRHSLFQVVSLRTNTGFATADYNDWGFLALFTLLFLMLVGACAGSTGGGIKVLRLLIGFKAMALRVEQVFRPSVVRPLRVGPMRVSPDMRLDVMIFILAWVAATFGGGVLVMVFEPEGTINFGAAFSAAAATICNAGPGIGPVGATGNFGFLSDASKIVLSILMVVGRLELYAVAVLILPRFWKGD